MIGVIGNPAIAGELNAIADRKSVGSQAIKVKEINSSDEMGKMHIVYVAEGKSDGT